MSTEPELLEALFGTLVHPRRTFQSLAQAPSSRSGAAAVALTAMGWGALALLLWTAGRVPAFPLLPIPGEAYYLVQGVLSLPILTALYWILTQVAHRLSVAAKGGGTVAATGTCLGFAYAVPLGLHVGAEMTAYLFFGFEALALTARISLPVAALWVWGLSALGLHEAHGLAWSRAVAISFFSLLAQAVVGALILR